MEDARLSVRRCVVTMETDLGLTTLANRSTEGGRFPGTNTGVVPAARNPVSGSARGTKWPVDVHGTRGCAQIVTGQAGALCIHRT